MKDLEKRLSIIEEKFGISNVKTKLEVGKWYLFVGHLDQCKPLMYITSISDERATFRGFNFKGKWTGSDFYPLSELDEYGYREATNQEVEETLVKEAKRRGFLTQGTFFKSFTDGGKVREVQPFECYDGKMNTIKLSFYNGFLYYEEGLKTSDGLCSNPRVFENGKWAEVIEQPVDKFAELKEAHRNGAEIQVKYPSGNDWYDCDYPRWFLEHEYRIKPTQQSSLEQDIQQLKDKYKQYKFTITIEDNI